MNAMQVIACSACKIRLLNPYLRTVRRWRSGGGVKEEDSPLKRLVRDSTSFGERSPRNPELEWATLPYADAPTEYTRARVEPVETTVLLFPGQGSQFVGMGLKIENVPAARDFYEFASSVVGWDVWRTCTSGTVAELESRVQTCIVVTSLAALEAAKETRPDALERVKAVAGHSLGEIPALVFAGALHPEAALKLVELRAAAMSAASKERPSGLVTVWTSPAAKLSTLCTAAANAVRREDAVCEVAGYLYPECKIIGGDEEAIKFIEKSGSQFGVKRSKRIRVAGAFHTRIMAPASDAMGEATRLIKISDPRVRVISCLSGQALKDARAVARALIKGPMQPLRWEQALHNLYARPQGEAFPRTLALGPHQALRSTLRQVNAKAWDFSVPIDV